ncbi:SPFH domain-containing protein [Streptomyces sp. CS131]|uniref:SPFH domain-containing protein n=1 Tax=Streptomyces sp. CS131 TaxID=2162711 RepID=UPI000D515E19|nr:SPFH domain-containing protein [Streptomyces sp. CS131]PVC87368.1 membrane protease subunit [Streptomyces sp. CS131]
MTDAHDVTERNREPVTTDNDQTPHSPDDLDDQLPPSLFAPPGRGTPPPLFGPVDEKAPPPGRDPEPVSAPAPVPSEKGGGGVTPPPPGRTGGGSTPPPLFRPVSDGTPPPVVGPVADKAVASADAGPARVPDGDKAVPPASAGPARVPGGGHASPSGGGGQPSLTGGGGQPSFTGGGDHASPSGGGTSPSAPPRTAAPESPNVSLHLGPTPDRPAAGPARSAAEDLGAGRPTPAAGGRGPAPAGAAADGPAPISGRPAAGGPGSARSAADGPAPASVRPGAGGPASASGRSAADGRGPVSGRPAADGRGPASGRPAADAPAPTPTRPAADGRGPASARPGAEAGAPARPAPLDGNLHLKPVRRSRTEPSAEWTPHPSYGAEPETPKREARDIPAKGADPGPDTELDLVLDLAPGDRAASATFSVPAPASAPTASVSPGRRHSVIANETTASIPVHLLFRDDQEPADGAAALPGPGAVVHRPAGDRAPATRRPPVPRSPQTRVRPSTRPAPVADPRLAERPGPALSGYAALLTGAAGTAGALAVLWWRGVLPAGWQGAVGLTPRPDLGIGAGAWAALALLATVVLLALGGLGRGRVGYAWVLTLFGDYRGSVRRTGLVWVSPLLLRRRVDVRLRHWRSEPLPAVDANGTALRVVVLVVWRIKDTVRAVLGIEDHEAYLSAQVEAAMARVLSQLPADAFHEDAPTLRDAEAVGDALTRMLKADCEPVGVEVYSAQPTGIEYAPEVAAAMQRRRIAAIDSRHRDSVLTSVVDAVDDTVNRLTTRGIVELDDYERKALVKDLTVAFYTGRSGGGDGA